MGSNQVFKSVKFIPEDPYHLDTEPPENIIKLKITKKKIYQQ